MRRKESYISFINVTIDGSTVTTFHNEAFDGSLCSDGDEVFVTHNDRLDDDGSNGSGVPERLVFRNSNVASVDCFTSEVVVSNAITNEVNENRTQRRYLCRDSDRIPQDVSVNSSVLTTATRKQIRPDFDKCNILLNQNREESLDENTESCTKNGTRRDPLIAKKCSELHVNSIRRSVSEIEGDPPVNNSASVSNRTSSGVTERDFNSAEDCPSFQSANACGGVRLPVSGDVSKSDCNLNSCLPVHNSHAFLDSRRRTELTVIPRRLSSERFCNLVDTDNLDSFKVKQNTVGKTDADVVCSQNIGDMSNANNGFNAPRQEPDNAITSGSRFGSLNRCSQQSQPVVPAPPKRRPKRKDSPTTSPKSKRQSRTQRNGSNSGRNVQPQGQCTSTRSQNNRHLHNGSLNTVGMMGGVSSVDSARNERTNAQSDVNRTSPHADSSNSGSDHLPDILNAHMPPPYSTLPQTTERSCHLGPPPPHILPPPVPACGTLDSSICPPSPRRGHRFTDHRYRRSHRGLGVPGGTYVGTDSEDQPKHCCGVAVTQTVSIRWFIVMIAFVGLCCAVIGTVLGALKATGREHLTVSLLMIGVGIVLITVSGIAWRLTSHDAPSCRMMLGLNSLANDPEPNHRFVPRVPPTYGRPHHPYAAMMYPEFQYRPPPPSYQASMQEYRLRLLLLDRQQPPSGAPAPLTTSMSPVSPPPTYRSHNSGVGRPSLNFVPDADYSRPPSYRSRASSALQSLDRRSNVVNSNTNGSDNNRATNQSSCDHSRNPSLSLSYLSHESLFGDSLHSRQGNHQNSIVTVVETHPNVNAEVSNNNTASSRSSESGNNPLQISRIELSTKSKEHADKRSNPGVVKGLDINMVTIVQTTDSSQVLSQDSVIVTVSGRQQDQHHNMNTVTTPSSDGSGVPVDCRQTGEVEILAHL